MTTSLVRCSIVAVAILATAVPANAGGSFNIHIGTPGFGLSFGTTTWAPYGQAWSDPAWSVNFGVALDGYGDWVYVSGLGRVWRPWVAPDWRPFTHGRWVWTSVGWTWVAYEPWGWIPHHFGHWAYAPAGWVWVPGTVWHPGNVTWVSHAGWVGWYPCPPRGWSHAARGWSRGYAHGYADGYGDGWRDARYATWVDWRHLGTSEDVSRVAVTRDRISRLDAPGSVEVLARAPSRVAVEARTRQPVAQASLERRAVTIDGRTVSVARPAGTVVDEGLRRSAPRTVEAALVRSAQPSRPTAAPTRRVEVPSVRSTAPAARSNAVVIDDAVVRSMRPRPDGDPATPPASGSRPSTRVVQPRVAPVRPTVDVPRPVTPVSDRVAAGRQRPESRPEPSARPEVWRAASPVGAVSRVAPEAHRVPVTPVRPAPGRMGAATARSVSRPPAPTVRQAPPVRAAAPSATPRRVAAPTQRTAAPVPSSVRPKTAAPDASGKPTSRSGATRRSNR